MTKRQAEVLAWLDRPGQQLSTYEMATLTGLSHSGVSAVIHRLASLGYIRVVKHRARGIEIIKRRDGNSVLIRGQWYEYTPISDEVLA